MAMSAERKSAPRRAAGAAPEAADVPADESVEESAPLNRAERRGRAKKGGNPQASGGGKVTGRSSAPQGPRLYSNRRGGG
jgi:hypothetical protein